MYIFARFIDVVEAESSDNKILGLYDMLNDFYLRKWNLAKTDTSEYFSVGKSWNEIPKNTVFEVIVSLKDPKNYVKCQTKLIEICTDKDEYLDGVPVDLRLSCLIDFPDGKPEILSKIKIHNEERTPDNDYLFLTTQTVMDKILKKIEEAENSAA